MKNKLLFSSRCQIVAQGWLVGLALLAWGTASAQNFVKNPDFEEPLGPDNWTVEYAGVSGTIYINEPTNSGPNDFLIKGRTCAAHMDMAKAFGEGTWDGDPNYWNKFGAHFQANHTWLAHAYFKQVVTNLTPGASYACSAWMALFDPSGTNVGKYKVYMETVGGATKKTPYVTGNSHNNPAGWQRYAVTNTADGNGQIELRLQFIKDSPCATWSYRQYNGFYDHVAVVPEGGQAEPTPPYNIDSFGLVNQTPTFQFDTVSNHIYRVLYGGDLTSVTNWAKPLFWVATGTNMTVTSDVTGDPRYFRIYRLWPYP